MLTAESRIQTPAPGVRWAPIALLGVSLALGWLTTGELIRPDRMAMSLLPSVVLLALRLLLELVHPRLRVGGTLVTAAYLLHAVLLIVAVALNPFLCIYAFFGYVDAERLLGPRLDVPAVVLTGLTCGFGQSGGLPGVDATPVLFLILSAVNVSLALTMRRFMVLREREVAARERAVAELAEAHRQNLELQQQLLRRAHAQGTAEERARLSRELHDTVAQGLVGVIRQLETLPADLPDQVRGRIDRAEAAARGCLTDARRAVRALGPQQLEDATLIDAVSTVVENWSLTHDIPAEVRLDGIPRDGATDDVALRVVQEALSNVARHAGAASVTVTLSWLVDQLIVDVRDDGTGFDPLAVTRGRGLDGMAERLRAASGRLEVESSPGEGSTVVAVMPR